MAGPIRFSFAHARQQSLSEALRIDLIQQRKQ